MTDAPQAAAPQEKVSAFGLPLLVLSLLQFMVVVDGTVVNLALAPIQRELGLSESASSWVITAYALAYGGLLLLGGRIGDVLGRKRAFLIGVGTFTVASLLCGLSRWPIMLILSRVLQGLGAAIASPSGMALIVVTYPPGKARNQAFAVWSVMTGLGSVFGLIIGGALTSISWEWIFLINVPIGIFIVIAGHYVLGAVEGQRVPLDIWGAILATLGSTALVLGLTSAGKGASNPVFIVAMLVGIASLGAFFITQKHTENGVLPLSLFTRRDRVFTFIAIFLLGAIMTTVAVFVALYVQTILKYTTLRAGLAFIPFAFALALGAATASKISMKWAPRWIILAGCIFMVIGFGWGTAISEESTFWADIFPPTLIIGYGVGLVSIALTLSAVAGVKPIDVGPLTAISLVAQTLGGPIGLAFAGALAQSYTRHHGGADIPVTEMNSVQLHALGEGYLLTLFVCLGLAVVMGILSALFIRFTVPDVVEGQKANEAANDLP